MERELRQWELCARLSFRDIVIRYVCGVDHWGRYIDELVQVGGRWRISYRCDIIDGSAAGDWADHA